MSRLDRCAGVAAAVLLSGAVAAQDGFRFREGRSRAASVNLAAADGGAEFLWPEAAGSDWDTAVLGVDVSAEDTAQPYVEISSDGVSDRQYFGAGDVGARWLNLSFLRGRVVAGARVSLRGAWLRLAPGDATLRLFATRPDLSKPILVLAPHPDDAEIASFGVYARRNATVVTVTVGNAGDPSYEAVFSEVPELYWFKGHIRLIDSITVPWQGGIPPERCFNLGYFDARLAEMHDKPNDVIPEMYGPNVDIGVYLRDNIGSLLPRRSRASKWTHLVDDVEKVLKKVKPALILAPHPQLDTHWDHQFTTVALAQALERWKKPVTLLLYTNHADQNKYPYGPAGTLISLPPPAGDVLLDRVYSHPVAPELQRLKLFALESMHDLRMTPTQQYQALAGDGRALHPERTGSPMDVSYLRRGPRSNELFYTYDRDSLKPMIEDFLRAWRASRSGS